MKGPHVTAMELIPKNAQIIQILALVASIFMKGATKFQAVFVQIYGTKMTWNFFAINTVGNALIGEGEIPPLENQQELQSLSKPFESTV